MPIRRLARVLLIGAVLVICAVLTMAGMAAAQAAEVPAPSLRLQAPLPLLQVTRRFEPPPTPYAAGHRGVDLGSAPAAVVRAAAAGVISYAGPLAGRGVVVVVHGALRTTYEPVTAAVRRGAPVTAGQRIGTLEPGHAGCPVAACLHWGLLRGDVYLDPLGLVGPRPVRLLPLSGHPARADPAAARALAPAAAPVAAPVAGISQAAATAKAGAEVPGSMAAPDTVKWSLVALAGAGAVLAGRRRR
jgi:murein DD-endopeptidase MepM/ murein hydrolase activator NlpD